jgi:hypothetical protein
MPSRVKVAGAALIGGAADQNSGRTEAAYFPIRLLHAADYVNRILKGTKPAGHAADQVRAGDQPVRRIRRLS